MTLPDTGSERPGGLASDTRQMAEHELEAQIRQDALGSGPRGRVTLLVAALIVIAVVVWLVVR
jgi:hypothetical protein